MASDKTTCIGIRTQKLDPQNKVEHYWMLFIKLLSKYFLSLGNQVQIVEKHQYFMTICLQASSSCFVVEFWYIFYASKTLALYSLGFRSSLFWWGSLSSFSSCFLSSSSNLSCARRSYSSLSHLRLWSPGFFWKNFN